VVNFMYGDVTGNGDWGGYDGAHMLEHVAQELAGGNHHTFPIELTAPVWAPLPLSHADAETVANVDQELKDHPDYPGDLTQQIPDIAAMDAAYILQAAVGIITELPIPITPAAPSAATMAYALRGDATSERPGAVITVSLDAATIPELHAGELVLSFDPALLKHTGAAMRFDASGDAASRPLLSQGDRDETVAIAFASGRPITGGNAILDVTFEAATFVAQPREGVVRVSHLRLNGTRIATDFAFPFRIEPYVNRLMPNYPNPFNPETWIPFELTEEADVTVRIYRQDGSLVRTLALGRRAQGLHVGVADAARWDGRNEAGEQVASGVYVYELKAGAYRASRRMVIMK
jgi:hypothetical protein